MLAVDDIKLQRNDALSDFKEYYENFSKYPLSKLEDIYDANVIFVDPLHQIQGMQALRSHFDVMCSGLDECRFEFLDQMVDKDQAWFRWHMHYAHPKLDRGDQITITGASQIRWVTETGKVIYHEDFYDMGAMLYERIPLLGTVIKTIKKRL